MAKAYPTRGATDFEHAQGVVIDHLPLSRLAPVNLCAMPSKELLPFAPA
jgi:hypothetical protein